MSQSANTDVTNGSEKRRTSSKETASIPVRIRSKTKEKVDAYLARINKDRLGRKVKPDDLICFSLDLLNDAHLEEIGTSLLTNKERVEILYRKLAKTKRGLSKDEFLGMLLEGKVTA